MIGGDDLPTAAEHVLLCSGAYGSHSCAARLSARNWRRLRSYEWPVGSISVSSGSRMTTTSPGLLISRLDLLSNPNGPERSEQQSNLLNSLKWAADPRRAAAVVLSEIYSRQQAENPALQPTASELR
jgi:hypothetical protein